MNEKEMARMAEMNDALGMIETRGFAGMVEGGGRDGESG